MTVLLGGKRGKPLMGERGSKVELTASKDIGRMDIRKKDAGAGAEKKRAFIYWP